jgi:hypothetical protein
VLVREGGQWKLVQSHASIAVPNSDIFGSRSGASRSSNLGRLTPAMEGFRMMALIVSDPGPGTA